MLSLMRKHAGTWMIKVILGAIVIVFVFWGVGSWTSQRSGRVATVNGETIVLEDYRTSYNRLLEQVRQSFGNNLNDDLIKSLQLRKRAMDQVVDRLVLLQEARKLHLEVSDAELSRYIQNIEAFQTAGVFDTRRYMNILNSNRLTPEAFELSQRDAILLEKLNSFITDGIKISDSEAMEWYNYENAEVDIEYVLFSPDTYQNITPQTDEIDTYFAAHKESYKIDPELKVRYFHFKPETYADRVTISEDEVQDYYETNFEQFQVPNTVEARHILIKVGQEATPEEEQKARKRIEEIHELVKSGKDFAEMAKQYSEGPSKDEGGYIGEFEREAMVKPFADKAFEMKAGEISDPVRTQFGWHIIKVEKVTEARTRTLDEADAEIRKKLTEDHSKSLAFDEAETVYDAAYDGEDLQSIATARKYTLQTTDFFSQRNPPKTIANGGQFSQAAFSLALEDISDIQDLGDGYYIIQPLEKKAAAIPELETVRDRVIEDLIKEKQDEMAKKEADSLLADLKAGAALAEAAKKSNLTPASTGFFKRNDSIPEIGYEAEISKIAFQLSDQNRLPEAVAKSQKGYYVVLFKARTDAAVENFDSQKAEIKQRLLQQKQFQTYDAFLKNSKNSSEIWIDEKYTES